MRHRKFSQRLSRPPGARKATVRNLVIALLKYQRIRTTRAKAHLTQRVTERLISLAKENSLPARRQARRILNDRSIIRRLFSRIGPLFKNKTSGFSRVVRLPSPRSGDGAEMVFLELTEKLPPPVVKVGKKEEVKEKPAPAKEPARPKVEVEPERRAPKPAELPRPVKKIKPKKFLGGLRKLFKKERDAL